MAGGERVRGGGVAVRYHEETKHSPRSVRRRRHVLDWAHRPSLLKEYDRLPRTDLPRDLPRLGVPALDALAEGGPTMPARPLDLPGLARILSLGAGVLRKATTLDGEVFLFRTYASAGALYPVEVYVVGAGGLDHYDPLAHALTRLRDGDHRPDVVRASGEEPAVRRAEAVLVLTGIPGRTGWKYTERGYRHLFWDAGMILANVLALAASGGQPARVVTGFADAEVEALLGLDGRREFPLCLVALGAGNPVPPASVPPPAAAFPERLMFTKPIEFPLVLEANDAGRLAGPAEAAEWRSAPLPQPAPPADGSAPEPAPASPDSLESVIRRRGSARSFTPDPVPARILARILERATAGVPTDLTPGRSRLTEVYLIANAVEGLDPGAYRYGDGRFLLLRAGRLRGEAGGLCLEQRLGADAAATCFLMADLGAVLEALGDRGYRVAQLEAGIVAGKIYLGAHAYRLGATGLTFYDDDVTGFFSPDAAGKSCMLVTAVGCSIRRLLPLA